MLSFLAILTCSREWHATLSAPWGSEQGPSTSSLPTSFASSWTSTPSRSEHLRNTVKWIVIIQRWQIGQQCLVRTLFTLRTQTMTPLCVASEMSYLGRCLNVEFTRTLSHEHHTYIRTHTRCATDSTPIVAPQFPLTPWRLTNWPLLFSRYYKPELIWTRYQDILAFKKTMV